MTITLKGERTFQILTGSNNDTVITAFDLPADSVLKRIGCKMDIVGVTLAQERESAFGYAIAAYLIELDDPDAVVDYDVLWDRFVPKYTDVDTIDLDTGVADTTPFWEPGEANFQDVFDMGDKPLRLFMRRKVMNFADPGSSGFRFQPSETPFEPQWMAADKVFMRVNKSIRIRKPSVMIVAIGSPGFDDTTTTRPTLIENEWGQIQFVESTLERALIDQLNVIEPGAETPWEDASAVLRKHLAPDVFEQIGGSFVTENFNVFGHMQFEHTVPGSMDFSVVDLTP